MCNDAGYAFAREHEDDREGQVPGPVIQPYTASQVFGVLQVLGYNASQADLAMTRAMSRGSWPLSRHVVRYDSEAGTYTVMPRRAS